MNLFALNTSGFSASLALGVDLKPKDPGFSRLNLHRRDHNSNWICANLARNENTAQFLIPRMQSLLQEANLEVKDVDLFAVTSGPGSFTGLRIGITTVKTLAFATGAKVTGINSLSAIAQNALMSDIWTEGKLTVIINAFRKQFFVATFARESFGQSTMNADKQTTTIDQSSLADYVERESSLVVGPGTNNLDAITRERLNARLIELGDLAETVNESAIGVGQLALSNLESSIADPMLLMPQYFRGSAAEEKLANK